MSPELDQAAKPISAAVSYGTLHGWRGVAGPFKSSHLRAADDHCHEIDRPPGERLPGPLLVEKSFDGARYASDHNRFVLAYGKRPSDCDGRFMMAARASEANWRRHITNSTAAVDTIST